MKWYDKQKKVILEKLTQEKTEEIAFEIEKEMDDIILTADIEEKVETHDLQSNPTDFYEEEPMLESFIQDSLPQEESEQECIEPCTIETTMGEIVDGEVEVIKEDDEKECVTNIISEEVTPIETDIEELPPTEEAPYVACVENIIVEDNIEENNTEVIEEETIEPIVDEEKEELPLPTSTISEETQLSGNIEMHGHMHIYGTVIGNIECIEDIHLFGNVEGDITCRNIIIDHATVLGNINCKNLIEIKEDSQIKGNIKATELLNAGSIIGDINVAQTLSLTSSAHVEGSVQALTLDIQKGATLNGPFTVLNDTANT